MILTVTPNPSVDRTMTVEALQPGQVQSALTTHLDPGGKGINVTRALSAAETASLAILPIGGDSGETMRALLTQAGIDFFAVPIRQPIRSNLSIVEPDGRTTKINELGPRLSDDEVEQFFTVLRQGLAQGPAWVAGCGSLPPGMPTDFYAQLVHLAHRAGVQVAIDASAEALAQAVNAGPDLIKPNRRELGELVGRDLPTVGAVIDGAREAIQAGVGAALVSLGRDGAILVTGERVCMAGAQLANLGCAVGAGDCALGGFLQAVSSGRSATESLGIAVAWGTAAAGLPATRVPTPFDVAAATVDWHNPADPSRPLTD
ncbi:1-phosphofructokinase [Gephyromycinifex aptenodytis]|uniref:1-phosphofructokinase n=1 Tax=Gephyromycinifex aptenodytis TaxID=2716227 RepID=UPI001446ACE5|nr:1-phosphofructokinase [Gephyromycinifex aptenodytis]